jgi:hypothetical protein
MSRYLLPLVLLASLVGGSACSRAESEKTEKAEPFHLIDSAALVALQADTAHPVHVYDANNDEFRANEGTVPGAVLLSGHDFDLAATLPPDKSAPVVFYCSNKR